ncbi:S41 family peptidase [Flammeovirga sp. SubArs3]|uniref:S41 family peptidase n=1 Tax=Flammeovirga sp. SubArs3 TaxID=2995316 RepID=UPI00248AF917|nr:S41 family peptidase [Flammeovirga sp. SubArs3]
MFKNLIQSLFVLLIISSCTKDEPDFSPASTVDNRDYLKELMESWYLWNDELPANITPSNYSNQDEMLLSLRNEQDRWSNIEDKAAYEAYYESGQVTDENTGAHGIYLQYDEQNDLYVRFSYPGSAANTAGLKRGTKIQKVNGLDVASSTWEEISESMGENNLGVTNTFEIEIPEIMNFVDGQSISVPSEIKEITISKEAVIISPVLHSSVITVDQNGQDVKVGHVVFKSFIETASVALNEVFADFKAQGVTEVVLDMRYNGGGRVDIAAELCGYLAPSSAAGKDIFRYRHNEQQTENNEDYSLELQSENLNLERVFMLTTANTASASELMINALRPFMDVQVVGQNTHGKPVGSYGFENNDFIYSVISLRILNADDEGDYFEGLPVNQSAIDDPSYYWSDVREPMLYQALHQIQYGQYDQSSSSARKMKFENINNRNLKIKEGREASFETILKLK